MADDELEKSGFELDRIELPKITPPKAETTPSDSASRKQRQSAKSAPRYPLTVRLVLIGAVFALGAIMYLFWEHKVIRLPVSIFSKKPVLSEKFENIGPVTSQMGSAQVKMDIDVSYSNPKAKTNIARRKAAIRDRVLLSMGTQAAEKLVRERNLKELSSYLKDEINNTVLKDTPIEKVYFADIMFY